MNLKWFKNEPYKNVGGNIPDSDGVYALCTLQDSGKYKVRYIGQGNLKDRLVYHLSENEENIELKQHIKKGYKMKASYAEVGAQKDRNAIEFFLYNKFMPEFNKITPPGNKEEVVNLFSLDAPEEK